MLTNLQGIAIGACTFIIIGLFHPLVIKGEYYFGKKVNIAFLIAGTGCLAGAFLCEGLMAASLLAIVAFSCFWSILEVNHQVRRVQKGWFPMNPKRKHEYEKLQDVSQDKKIKKACAFHNEQTL